jgi:hypothetical protein
MHHNRMVARRWWVVALVTGVTLAAVGGLAGTAQGAPAFDKDTGMFGLVRGQVARVSVVNVGDPNIQPTTCEGQLAIFASDGGVVAGPFAVRAAAGRAQAVDLAASSVEDPNEFDAFGRAELRVHLTGIGDPNVCGLTLSVFDSDGGRTAVFIGDPSIFLGSQQ